MIKDGNHEVLAKYCWRCKDKLTVVGSGIFGTDGVGYLRKRRKRKLYMAHIPPYRGYRTLKELGGILQVNEPSLLLEEPPHTSIPIAGPYLGVRGQKLAVDIVAWGSESANVRSGDSMAITETLGSKRPAEVMILSFPTSNIRIQGLRARYIRFSRQGVVEVGVMVGFGPQPRGSQNLWPQHFD